MLPEQNNSDHENWYKISKVIGNGSFGIVHEAFVLKTNELVAIKKVLQDPRYKNRELTIMKELSHPNIVELKDFYYTIQHSSTSSKSSSNPNNGNGNDKGKPESKEKKEEKEKEEKYLNLVLEYVPETVHRITRNFFRRQGFMPMNLVRIYAFQLCRAFGYLHSLDICHRDLKPHNLLIHPETNVLKLCDFGSAKRLVKGEWSVSYICSRFYRAPELMLGANEYSTSIDSWSIGCVLSEMILGRPLFCGDTSIDQLVKIIQILGTPTVPEMKAMNPEYNNINFPNLKKVDLGTLFPKNTDLEFIDMISQFLKYDPTQRLKPLDALTHPFFKEIVKTNTSDNNNNNNSKSSESSKEPTVNVVNKIPKELKDSEDSVVDEINLNLVPKNLTDFTKEEINYMSRQTREYFQLI